ncbi:hypothetical protein PFISCL1PPCAC_8652, partial [Pristionchus fissidentatus]
MTRQSIDNLSREIINRYDLPSQTLLSLFSSPLASYSRFDCSARRSSKRSASSCSGSSTIFSTSFAFSSISSEKVPEMTRLPVTGSMMLPYLKTTFSMRWETLSEGRCDSCSCRISTVSPRPPIECRSMAQKSKLLAKYFLRYWLNSFICARTIAQGIRSMPIVVIFTTRPSRISLLTLAPMMFVRRVAILY